MNTWLQRLFTHSWVVIAALVLLLLGSVYAITHKLSINTDNLNMLSQELGWRKNYALFQEQFPQFSNQIIILIEGENERDVRNTASSMYHKICDEVLKNSNNVSVSCKQKSNQELVTRQDHVSYSLVKDVWYPREHPFFKETGLLYLSSEEFESSIDMLSVMQPMLAVLAQESNLSTFTDLLLQVTDPNKNIALEVDNYLEKFGMVLECLSHGVPAIFPWQDFLSSQQSGNAPFREYLYVAPQLDYSQWLASADTISFLKKTAISLENPSVNIYFTGTPILEHEELRDVKTGSAVAGGIALSLLLFILVIGLGSIRLTIIVLLNLLVGLILTIGFAALFVGEINLISIAFILLYIGLGVDFAVHVCIHFRENFSSGMPFFAAIDKTMREGIAPLFMCAVTTSVGFYAFIFTDYVGIGQLGLITGTGIIIIFLLNLFLTPLLLQWICARRQFIVRVKSKQFIEIFHQFLIRYIDRRVFAVMVLSILLPIAFFWSNITFDANPNNLQNHNNEGVNTLQKMTQERKASPMVLHLLVDKNRSIGADIVKQLEKLDTVDRVIWLEDLIPPDQEYRLNRLDNLSILFAGSIDNVSFPAMRSHSFDNELHQLRILYQQIKENPQYQIFSAQLYDFLFDIEQSAVSDRLHKLEMLQAAVLQEFSPFIERIRALLYTTDVSVESLPSDVRQMWVSNKGLFRLMILPAEDIAASDPAAMRRFVESVSTVAPDAIGSPLFYVRGAETVVGAFQRAFALTIIVLLVFLCLLFRHNLMDVVIIFVTLAFSTSLVLIGMIIFDIDLNYANIIAIPLLFGVGVDSAIHLVKRFRMSDSNNNQSVFPVSTTHAVFLSSLTTLVGFVSLTLSHHSGTVTLGWLLTIGLCANILSSIVFLPPLMNFNRRQL